jgi:hypothetical protein
MNGNEVSVSPEDKQRFDEDGYHLLKSLLSPDEAKEYRRLIRNCFDLPDEEVTSEAIGSRTYDMADGVTKRPEFWPLIFNERLLGTIRALIGDDIRYTQHSDLHINLGGGRYHRDSRCREFGVGPDWDESAEPYRVVRVAIYLADYDDSTSAIVLLPGTHRRESMLTRYEYRFWNKARVFFRRYGLNEKLPHKFFSGPMVTHRTKPGDCAIFDQRLLHAGGSLTGSHPKYGAFLSYGLDNHHSQNHRQFFLERPNSTYTRDIPPELRQKLEEENLYLK